MAEVLYSLSTPSGKVLWESSELGPIRPENVDNPILDIVKPLYFRAEDMLLKSGLSVLEIRLGALSLVAQRPKTTIAAHPTVLEDPAAANEQTSLWYLPSDVLGMPKLRHMYRGPMLDMAKLRAPDEEVLPLEDDQEPFCLFATEVLPLGSRMDLHKDGRRPVIIINLSEPVHRGKSLLGHPDLLGEKAITVDMLLNDNRTLVQKLFPGCGVVFDVTGIPHVGLSDPGSEGYRIILDADYQTVGKAIDLSVYNSYE